MKQALPAIKEKGIPKHFVPLPFLDSGNNHELHKANQKIRSQQLMLRKKHNHIEESRRKLKFFTSMMETLTSTLKLDDIITGMFSELQDFMKADIVGLLITDKDFPCSRIISSRPIDKRTGNSITTAMIKVYKNRTKEKITKKDISTGLFYSPQKEERPFSSPTPLPLSKDDLTSAHSTLLTIEGKPIGMIFLYRFNGNFSLWQTRTFLSIVKQIALALNNSVEHMKILKMASTDGLTGVLNRRVFDDILKREFQRTIRYSSPLSLILVDIDHFKKVNDSYGHQSGDSVLRKIAHIMSGCIRDTDVLARFGGEEFAIILPETDKNVATLTAERIREKIWKSLFPIESGEISITASMGVSSLDTFNDGLPEGRLTLDDIIAQADSALYRAKAEGRNRVSLS